jgi:hypothetical protein
MLILYNCRMSMLVVKKETLLFRGCVNDDVIPMNLRCQHSSLQHVVASLFTYFYFGRVLCKPLIEGAIQYQPYVEDEGRKIKINITPVRADAVAGPTYTYIIDKLNIPASLMVI